MQEMRLGRMSVLSPRSWVAEGSVDGIAEDGTYIWRFTSLVSNGSPASSG